MQHIIGKYIKNDVWFSRQTIKGIMTTDLVSQLEDKNAGRPILTVDEYIKDFIQRMDNVEKTMNPIKKNRWWWDR